MADFRHFCRLYMDDVVIFSDNLDDHWMHINANFSSLTRISGTNFMVQMDVAKTKIEYIGIEYSARGMWLATHIMDKLNSLFRCR